MRFALAAVAALLIGAAVAATDFYTQMRRAEGDFGGPQYVASLIHRLDGSGGLVGLMFRKSAMITPALPPAPEGWSRYVWSEVSYDGLYSPAQMELLDHHILQALGDTAFLDGVSAAEEELSWAYSDDVTVVYLGAEGRYIELGVKVEGMEIGSEIWREYEARVERHFDKVDTLSPYDTVQDLDWYERSGPVERAGDGLLPHDLRMFEADMGRVEIYLVTRAPEADLRRFMASLDLRALRELNARPVDAVMAAAPSAVQEAPQQRDPARAGDAGPASGGGSAVVVARGGECGAGQFCRAGQ